MTGKYVRNPDVVVREENAEGALLFNPDTNQIKLLNLTAFAIWNLCDGSRDLPALVKAVSEQFDGVPADKAAKDITQFVDHLVKTQLLGYSD